MPDLSGLRVKLLHPKAKLPTKGKLEPGLTFDTSAGAFSCTAGYDLYATRELYMYPKARYAIPIGIATEIPHGYFGLILDRSGLASKDGITVLGGVIDNDYRGEWQVVLLNTGIYGKDIKAGDRIAQVVFLPYGDFSVSEVFELSDTERGEDGLGSTGA